MGMPTDDIASLEVDLLELESDALVGFRSAATRIVGLERDLRAAIRTLLASRYSDGACDGPALQTFENATREALEKAVRE